MAKKNDNTIKELRAKEADVLRSEILQKKREYAAKKLKFRLGTDKNSSVLGQLRIEIARIATVIKEKEVLGS